MTLRAQVFFCKERKRKKKKKAKIVPTKAPTKISLG
jgi:hypothetical protein